MGFFGYFWVGFLMPTLVKRHPNICTLQFKIAQKRYHVARSGSAFNFRSVSRTSRRGTGTRSVCREPKKTSRRGFSCIFREMNIYRSEIENKILTSSPTQRSSSQKVVFCQNRKSICVCSSPSFHPSNRKGLEAVMGNHNGFNAHL